MRLCHQHFWCLRSVCVFGGRGAVIWGWERWGGWGCIYSKWTALHQQGKIKIDSLITAPLQKTAETEQGYNMGLMGKGGEARWRGEVEAQVQPNHNQTGSAHSGSTDELPVRNEHSVTGRVDFRTGTLPVHHWAQRREFQVWGIMSCLECISEVACCPASRCYVRHAFRTWPGCITLHYFLYPQSIWENKSKTGSIFFPGLRWPLCNSMLQLSAAFKDLQTGWRAVIRITTSQDAVCNVLLFSRLEASWKTRFHAYVLWWKHHNKSTRGPTAGFATEYFPDTAAI